MLSDAFCVVLAQRFELVPRNPIQFVGSHICWDLRIIVPRSHRSQFTSEPLFLGQLDLAAVCVPIAARWRAISSPQLLSARLAAELVAAGPSAAWLSVARLLVAPSTCALLAATGCRRV
jgi:hypothetical protein